VLSGIFIAIVFLPASAGAVGAIAQGFETTETVLPSGSLVGLKDSSVNVVEKATSARAYVMMGITADKPLIAIGGDAQQVQVVVSGLTTAIVSDINGDIKIGDRVTASPISGVGMKAQESTQVVGIAETNLSSSKTTTERVTDKQGKSTDVKIGTVTVQVNVSYYAAPTKKLDSLVPAFIINAGSSIAGKDVSPLRALIGFSALLIGFVLAAIMLQAAIRSGIISLGRNPLAHASVRRSLVDVLVTSVGVLLVTALAFYLILSA
jgi:hypothetical protein